jgi:hypothetical protein
VNVGFIAWMINFFIHDGLDAYRFVTQLDVFIQISFLLVRLKSALQEGVRVFTPPAAGKPFLAVLFLLQST